MFCWPCWGLMSSKAPRTHSALFVTLFFANLSFPLWSYPSTALVSPGSAGKKGGWVTYKLLLLRFEAALQGQERVTFAQSNFGPGLLCVEVADVRLSSAEAAARRTNPLACCHKHFSGIAVGLVWKLPWVRLFRPGSSPACSGAGHFAHCP